jgi:hypothetical protein
VSISKSTSPALTFGLERMTFPDVDDASGAMVNRRTENPL